MSEARDRVLKKYLAVCAAAASSDVVFARFKMLKAYTAVLEHCSYNIGLAHWNNIRHDYFSDEGMLKFLENDSYGSPIKYNFGQFSASPTTIQYISVLSNLITIFGSLQDFKIAEVGSGYFGQGKIILDMFKVKKYHAIDLYECTLLQEKYAAKLKCEGNIWWSTNENYEPGDYDLFISNYALTEVHPEDQLKYVQDICLNCKRGYITANQPLNGLDLLKEKFKVTISPDIQGERKTNYLITWG